MAEFSVISPLMEGDNGFLVRCAKTDMTARVVRNGRGVGTGIEPEFRIFFPKADGVLTIDQPP